MLHLVEKQVYKLELPAKLRIYNEFYMLLLKKDIIKKGRINKFLPVPEFEAEDNKEYEIEAIQDSAIYAKNANGNLSRLNYLVA